MTMGMRTQKVKTDRMLQRRIIEVHESEDRG